VISERRPAVPAIRSANAYGFGRWTIVVFDGVSPADGVDLAAPGAIVVRCRDDGTESIAVATLGGGAIHGRYARGTITAVPYPGARAPVPRLSPVVFRAMSAIVDAEPAEDAFELGALVRRVVEAGAHDFARLVPVAPGWVLAIVAGQTSDVRTYARDVRCRFTVLGSDGRMRVTETSAVNLTVHDQPSTVALIAVPPEWRDVVVYRESPHGDADAAATGAWDNTARDLHDVLATMRHDDDVRFALRAFVREAVALGAPEAETVLRARARSVSRQVADADKPFGFFADEILTFAGRGYVVRGWVHDRERLIEGAYLVPPNGKRLPIELDQCRMQRSDVLEFYSVAPRAHAPQSPGFVAFVEDPDAVDSRVDDVVLALRGGGTEWLACKQTSLDPLDKRARLLRAAEAQQVLDMARLAPAFEAAQREVVEGARVVTTYDFNDRPGAPRFSLVVPLYRRLDFVRYQLAEFANDPEMSEAEVVYVLDSPEQKRELLRLMESWSVLWPVRARLAVMASNAGYAAATNCGMRAARGEICVLLNSDVFPAAPGWLGRMATALDDVAAVGVVGARLLFEDTAIQHAGMYYALNRLGLWANEHFYKGYPADFPDANVSRYVPAVTGACMMVRRELFERLGGLSEEYCVGDFEDSDFCNKAAAAGYRSWYEATATLYHLERQSFPQSAYNHLGWQYNQWLHERRWRHAAGSVPVLSTAG